MNEQVVVFSHPLVKVPQNFGQKFAKSVNPDPGVLCQVVGELTVETLYAALCKFAAPGGADLLLESRRTCGPALCSPIYSSGVSLYGC